ncbi:hypothetical protein [Azospirillum sp. TSO22-1]|uniref:hypothetical protein n=1 Tax=Azospirillum sp. TSO22-1 TaxID=716789 RepID=UPI000D60DBBB|nr:hypothetical protein [Azospirillum sp. TSO22-1]PWC54346.1 hypothetical protein TSO221_08470 [Azospirillum sp. TSO22-1]
MSRSPVKPLTIDERLVIAAALDRILYDDPERFSAEDARLVRRLIPLTRTSWLSLGFRAETQGPSVGGEAAGVGPVEMEGDRKVTQGSVGEGDEWRCGQYKISNYGDGLEIWQVMSNEFDEEPKGARLEFADPIRLLFFRPRDVAITIPFTKYQVGLRLGGWGPWKVAA